MADICAVYTVAGLTFNATSGDTYITTDIQGLDGAPIRAEIDDKPQADGGLVFPLLLGARHVTFEGFIGVRTENFGFDKAGYIAVINAFEAALIAGLESIRLSPGTLAWDSNSLSVYYDSPVLFRGDQFAKRFIFGLVAPDPTIT